LGSDVDMEGEHVCVLWSGTGEGKERPGCVERRKVDEQTCGNGGRGYGIEMKQMECLVICWLNHEYLGEAHMASWRRAKAGDTVMPLAIACKERWENQAVA
jgi:hypothetical protein